MADNATRIVITADDRASGALGKIGDSVRRLGDSAGGLGALKASEGTAWKYPFSLQLIK